MNLLDGTFQNLEKGLNMASAKNKAIANNIANVDTPNYKAQQVQFKDELNSAVHSSLQAKRTHPRHISFDSDSHNQSYKVTTNPETTYNHNGNNVDIDKEMADLAKNQIYQQALVDRLNGKFGNLQAVLRGGR